MSSAWGRWIWPWTARRRAGGAASQRGAWRGGVAARERAWDACERGRVPRGRPGGAGNFPRVTKSTGGVRRAARTEQAGGERDGDKGISVISEIPGTSR